MADIEDTMIGGLVAFTAGEDGEECANDKVAVQITEVVRGGRFEVAFSVPVKLPANARIYLSMDAAGFLALLLAQKAAEP